MMRIIDFHTHVFPDDVARKAIPALEEEAGVETTYDGTLSGLLDQMDRVSIAVSVTAPVATKPTQVASINRWAASTASERIVPFGAAHPDSEDVVADVESVAALGMRGIKLHPEYQQFKPDDPRLAPLLEAAGELGLILLFHAGLDIGIPTDHGRPEAFARMLDAYPDVTVVLAHMGGWNLWDEVRQHLLGRPVYFDTSYSRGHMSDEDFVELVEAHGADRVLFGTDGPWADARDEVDWLESLPLSNEQKRAILHDNAAGLLGL